MRTIIVLEALVNYNKYVGCKKLEKALDKNIPSYKKIWGRSEAAFQSIAHKSLHSFENLISGLKTKKFDSIY